MNSYNDNLNSVVVASLQAQELVNKQLKSQTISSMFTLYHAEGSTITAQEKLEADQIILIAKSAVQYQAVQNSNISINLVASATQASSYVSQSVTNTALAAANTQVAGNAILKLAGDIGNIYSIVNAADFDTEIYNQSNLARELINKTAYLAEVATKSAMDASIKTSEVSAATVLSKAKATNALMNNLLQITQSEFAVASQTVATDNADVASASVLEKAAEGNYEDIVADYRAARNIYEVANEELNLGLKVNPITLLGSEMELIPTTEQNVTQKQIQFGLVTSPFAQHFSPDTPVKTEVKLHPDDNPVSDYYVLLVKEENKTTFSITEAESIILKGGGNYVQLGVTPSYLTPAPTVKGTVDLNHYQIFNPAVITRLDNNEVIAVENNKISMTVDFFAVNSGKMIDSDGDKIKMGHNYVVFLLAVYDNNYKRKLNNFEDYLSATSNAFKLANVLTPAANLKVQPILKDDYTKDWNTLEAPAGQGYVDPKADPDTYEITFSVKENPSFAGDVQYRTIILPAGNQVIPGLLTRSSLHDLENEVDQLQLIADEYDLLIARTHEQLLSSRLNFSRMSFVPTCQLTNPPTTSSQQVDYNRDIKALHDELHIWKEKLKKANHEEGIIIHFEIQVLSKAVSDMMKYFKTIGFVPNVKGTTPPLQKTTPVTTAAQQNDFNVSYNKINDAYAGALADKANAMAEIQQQTEDNFSFLFNLRIAEQVTPGNYMLPARFTSRIETGSQWPVLDFVVPFGPGTTDNFGTPLISRKKYTFVVLSYCIAEEQSLGQFINNWTIAAGKEIPFTYFEPEPKLKMESAHSVPSASTLVTGEKKKTNSNKSNRRKK
jgi:hypothetical protein